MSRLVWLPFLALPGCASVASSALQTAVAGHAPTTFEVEAQQEAEQRGSQYVDDPDSHSATCFRGSVSSTGPLGGPLDGVTVDAACATASATTKSDSSGSFHICVDRVDRGVLAPAFGGGPRYDDRQVDCRISYARDGYVTQTREVSLETDRRDQSLDAWLDASARAR